jgi:hypothetical protein
MARGWWWSCRLPDHVNRQANIHASCVAIGRAGVLLLGRSGAGKSSMALCLIEGGARLVADDRVLLSARDGALHARAPDSIFGLLEIRSVGIVAFPARKQVKIALAVRLDGEGARLPPARHFRPPPPLVLREPVPLIRLDGRSPATPARIRAALAAFSRGLFRDTFNPK